MGRLFGKFADGTDVLTGIIEHKNGLITKVTQSASSPFKAHRYDPKSFIIFPGFVDPLVFSQEHKVDEKKYQKHGFTHVRLVPSGKLKNIGTTARLREAKGKQYIAELARNYTDYCVSDAIKLFEAFTNSHGVHCTFLPELQSSLDRYMTNVSNASRHPAICEAEGLDLVLTVCEKYWVKAAILISAYSSLKKIYGSFQKGFVFYPLICLRHLVDNIDKLDDQTKPALRDEAIRATFLKNAFVMNTSIFTMLSDVEGLAEYPNYVRKLIQLGVSLKDIANASSYLPNEYLGRDNVGKIKVGFKADFTVLGSDGIVETYIDGELCR